MIAGYERANAVNSDLTDPLVTYIQVSALHSLSGGATLPSEF